MARRLRPPSPTAWLTGLIGTIAIALIGYYGRIAVIENMTERQMARSLSFQQQIKEQQQARQAQTEQAAEYALQQQLEERAKAAEETRLQADLDMRRRAAWNQFYKEPRGCNNWQSDQHMVECQNSKMRAKVEFDRKWVAGDFDQPQG